MYNKALTADNMAMKNWSCDPTCALCFCMLETTDNLLTECNFTEALWNPVSDRYNQPGFGQLRAKGGPMEWVRELSNSSARKEARAKLGIPFYFWWHVWKERNRRVFDGIESSVPQLFSSMQDVNGLFDAARGHAMPVRASDT
jgi:hypothetical protein